MPEIGQTISHYRIIEKLGQGGMGEVFLAHDSSLDRKVALKFLPDIFSGDPERLARFEREAKLLASLNHPMIAAIHGLEEAAGKRFLVMELVEGETLAQRIAKGPLPVDETLDVCRQIAEGLEAAHEKGIIHRDLKPANIKITPEGKVKVLDFGLAKAFQGDVATADASKSPTITNDMTRPGVILGTAAYMAPEQAKGKAVDKRADIWAFGCILYECLTGKRPFEGETITETLAAILKGEPNWQILPAATPWRVKDLLHRCFQKDLKERLHDIADGRIDISEALSQPLAGESQAARERGRRRIIGLWIISLLVVGAAASVVTRHLRVTQSTVVQKATILFPTGVHLTSDVLGRITRTELAFSLDGRYIVFSGSSDGSASSTQLYLRALDRAEAVPIAATEGARTPFFSPDGQWIAFFAQGKLKKIPLAGGIPVSICELAAPPMGATWSTDGRIIIGQYQQGLQIISADGRLEEVTTLDPTTEGGHRLPYFLPGGKTVLFTVMPHNWGVHGRIEVLSLDSGHRKVLVQEGMDAKYVPTGHLVYLNQGTMLAVPFDAESLEIRGSALPILEGVAQAINDTSGLLNSGAGQYAFSSSGALIYASGGIFPDQKGVLCWLDRRGNVEPIKSAGKRPFLFPRISPDGQKVAYESPGSDWSIWVHDLVRGTSSRLTGEGIPGGPIWTPDGNRITFESSNAGVRNLSWMPWDGSGSIERLTKAAIEQFPACWIPDGRLVFVAMSAGRHHIWAFRSDTKQASPLVSNASYIEQWPDCSPDGRWVAYGADQTGRFEIYVTALQDPSSRIPISIEGGREPLWARNGNELFYWTRDGTNLMVVDIDAKPAFHASRPRVLMSTVSHSSSTVKRNYDISPDGQSFLIVQPEMSKLAPCAQLSLVMNWFEELKHQAPTGNN
jgi:serine/threonine-protein kinase